MDTPDSPTDTRLDRRRLLQLGAAAAAAPTVAGVLAERARATSASHQQLEEMTIAQMQAELTSGRLTSRKLTKQYLDRIQDIDRRGPKLNSVLELNPEAEEIARGPRPGAPRRSRSAVRCTGSRS